MSNARLLCFLSYLPPTPHIEEYIIFYIFKSIRRIFCGSPPFLNFFSHLQTPFRGFIQVSKERQIHVNIVRDIHEIIICRGGLLLFCRSFCLLA